MTQVNNSKRQKFATSMKSLTTIIQHPNIVLSRIRPNSDLTMCLINSTSGFNRVGNGGPKRGQLKNFVTQWETVGAPPPLISLIQGNTIPFSKVPPFQRLAFPFSQKAITPPSPQMDSVVQSLLQSERI